MERILGPNCDVEVADRLMDEVDVDKTGLVNYVSFSDSCSKTQPKPWTMSIGWLIHFDFK